MNITKVQIHPYNNPNSKIKAFADIIIDNEFIIRNLTVFAAEDQTHYVNMPNKEKKDHTRMDVAHPITEDCRSYIENTVLDAYEDILNNTIGRQL